MILITLYSDYTAYSETVSFICTFEAVPVWLSYTDSYKVLHMNDQ